MTQDYESLRDSALIGLKQYMDTLDSDKGKKLAYWIKDYTRFLSLESSFQPQKLIRYKRGAIVKVHLGYRIGSEEGGLHYAVVMDKNNSLYSPILTVIPLTSIKNGVDLSKHQASNVPLGSEIYSILSTNLSAEIRSAKQHLADSNKLLATLPNQTDEEFALIEETIKAQHTEIKKQLAYCQKMQTEVNKMKVGSIALVGQITTISKLRVYDPRYKGDALAKVRVSNATLDKLDAKIVELFTCSTNNKQ